MLRNKLYKQPDIVYHVLAYQLCFRISISMMNLKLNFLCATYILLYGFVFRKTLQNVLFYLLMMDAEADWLHFSLYALLT